ncbi:putative pentatricopeptide repeat-containing protein At3g01580 [Selaginella moellendorffii]|uniref:putative pentatricopeptide repeat-containing protein At3g01580 n=1 Tax=Selaginella moellendorffii TaxID=88036 RepID=UPI000D1CA538|nr:putative pentatricopeptide repeat-containing protein At3g01580 [Selaginella moellendorffii]|eukprot:XP_024528478.1 putative pentatricopeptide repeat-containing protein At3g01580 [Selaginella moellendorffii]
MIGAYVNNGLDEHALDLYKRMAPALPSAVTFVSVLEVCSSLVDVNSLHGRIKELGLETNPVVATALINAFSAAGSLLSAEEAFHCVDCKDAVCWTSMITAFARNGDGIGALKTFSRMNLEEKALLEKALQAREWSRIWPSDLKSVGIILGFFWGASRFGDG